MRSHFKPTETFQYTHYSSCHPLGVSKGFIKGEALRLLRTNSSKTTFEENICNFRVHLRMRGKESRLYRDKRRKISHCNITHQWLIYINGKMALDREPTLTQGNIQGAPFHLLQKGEILKRYTCESKTLRVNTITRWICAWNSLFSFYRNGFNRVEPHSEA